MIDPMPLNLDELMKELRLTYEFQFGEGGEHQGDADCYFDGELAMAAASYAMLANMTAKDLAVHGAHRMAYPKSPPPDFWPLRPVDWAPRSPRADLLYAAGLLLGEVARIDRLRAVKSKCSKAMN